MARVNSRRALLAVLAVCALMPASASAFTAADGRAAADRAAIAWAHDHQQRDGAFVDYVSRRPTYGYSGVMIGYGLLRAGVRAHDDGLIRSGFRAIGAVLSSDHPQRGVFDSLANATAYEFAARELPDDPSFKALRPHWETYLRSISKPYIKSTNLQACTADPVCFHNHEVVGAFGDLQLLKTRLSSTVPGAKLADPAGLRGQAEHVLSVEIPQAVGGAARSSFGGERAAGLGLLSDTGTWPLAYHAFSTAMLAGAAADLGREVPAATSKALRGTVGALAGLIGPDGDVAYLGRRQEQGWALASTVYTATVAERLPGVAAGQLRTVADRAFARLTTVNRTGPGGLGAVPRQLSPHTGYHGVDANEVVPAALTIFMLNLASDAAGAAGDVKPGSLPADADGYFLEPEKTGFAAVRHGDLWYAVHRRTITYDLRYDFGLVALKRRDAEGHWHDVLRPRPNSRGPNHNSAGPVILVDGVRYLPYGDTIAVERGGVVVVRGGFRSEDGVWLRRGVTFRFAPVKDGVALSFPLKGGDDASMATYMPAAEARHRGGTVFDSHVSATVSGLRPHGIEVIDRGYGSCCDAHLVAATAELRPRRDVTVTYTMRARATPRSAAAEAGSIFGGKDDNDSLGSFVFAALAVIAAGILGTVLSRRRRGRSKRRVRR